MSVNITALDGREHGSISNGTWAAFVAVGIAFGEETPAWNGCHDGQFYSPEQLRKIADRVDQLASLNDIIRSLADGGGFKVL